jgi:hypothetical protein
MHRIPHLGVDLRLVSEHLGQEVHWAFVPVLEAELGGLLPGLLHY